MSPSIIAVVLLGIIFLGWTFAKDAIKAVDTADELHQKKAPISKIIGQYVLFVLCMYVVWVCVKALLYVGGAVFSGKTILT